MTIFDDPNREAVGLDPIWTETENPPIPDPEAEAFDPADHTVDEVYSYVTANPDESAAVLTAEKAGKNRVTLVEALEAR